MAGARIPALQDGDGSAFGAQPRHGEQSDAPQAQRQSLPGSVQHDAGPAGGRARRASDARLLHPSHEAEPLPPQLKPGTDPQRLPLLGWGARGPYVTEAQRLLNRLSRPSPQLAEDGRFGPLTHSAVLTYQQRTALRVDGLVGPHTWQALLQGRPAHENDMVHRGRAEEVLSAGIPFERLAPAAPPRQEVLHPFRVHLVPLPLAAPPAWWPQPKAANPYRSEPYKAALTNRSVASRLDGDARAGYTELPPGSCTVEFREFCEPLQPLFKSSISR